MKKLLTLLCAVTVVSAAAKTAGAASITIFSDDFNRSASNSVGEGWSEIEKNKKNVRITGNFGTKDGVQYKEGYVRLQGKLSKKSKIIKTADAAIYQTISLDKFSTLDNFSLTFDWRTGKDTEKSDKLFVSWDLGDGKWSDLWEHKLGGSDGFETAIVKLDFLPDVKKPKKFRLAFWTDVNKKNEAAYIDNVTLKAVSVPAPAAILLFGQGLIAMLYLGFRSSVKNRVNEIPPFTRPV